MYMYLICLVLVGNQQQAEDDVDLFGLDEPIAWPTTSKGQVGDVKQPDTDQTRSTAPLLAVPALFNNNNTSGNATPIASKRHLLGLTPRTGHSRCNSASKTHTSQQQQQQAATVTVSSLLNSPLLKLTYISSHGKRTSLSAGTNTFFATSGGINATPTRLNLD